MGTASSDGATFCVVLVADTSDGTKLGRGFMSVTEKSSEENTADGGWAHCGLLTAAATSTTTPHRGECAPGALFGSAHDPANHDEAEADGDC